MIRKDQYDVPVPAVHDFVTSSHHSERHTIAYNCFSSLCRLTIILGDILPLAYNLTIDQDDIWKQIRRLESDLDAWDDCLPDEARPRDGDKRRIPGCSNLRLGYLSIRLLLKRITLHVCISSPQSETILTVCRPQQYQQTRSANKIWHITLVNCADQLKTS
jgi:hypothetical protein